MTDIYIATTGNDTTGDGSSGNPYASFTKAMTVALALDTIYAADGVYSENTSSLGYWAIAKNLADWLTIQPTNGAAGAVTVLAASSTTYNTGMTNTTSHIRFKWITFGILAGSRYAFRINTATVSYIDFQNCTFTGTPSSNSYGVLHAGSSNAPTNITLTDCVISATGATGMGLRYELTGTPTFDWTFTRCTISSEADNAGYFSIPTGCTYTINFVDCTFTTTASAKRAVSFLNTSSPGAGLSFTRCTFTASSETSFYCIISSAVCTLIFTDCIFNVSSAFSGLLLNGVTCTLTRPIVNVSGTGAKGFYFGADSESGGYATTVVITGGYIVVNATATTHAVLFGNGCVNCICDGLTIIGVVTGYGIVLKEHTGTEIKNCLIMGGSVTTLYFKAAVNANVHNNRLSNSIATKPAVQMVIGATNNTSSGCTLTHNTITLAGTAVAFAWNTNGDGNNNICDYNRYCTTEKQFGAVRGTAIKTLAQLRAAWAGYTNPDNDMHSSLIWNNNPDDCEL